MTKILNPILTVALLKRVLVMGILVYAGVITVMVFKLKPVPILIGIDSYGTRIITRSDDALLRREKENLMKQFISEFYNFDQTNYSEKLSHAGDLMSLRLWNDKKSEFEKIAKKLTDENLSQNAKIVELRQVDENTFQADLLLHIERKLTPTDLKLRIEIQIQPHARSTENPYPYEVDHYDEQQIL